MSTSNSTIPPVSNKPPKPSADFPLTPHATGRWCKKIKGKLVYFGTWADPDGALKEYRDFLAGKPRPKKRRRGSELPSKPNPAFPLTAHPGGQWVKRIRGKLHYFGAWADPDAALAKYLEQKDALHAGRSLRPDSEGSDVHELVNHFLDHKQDLVDIGELSPRTWTGYKEACDEMVAAFGKRQLLAGLLPEDFAAIRNKLARRNGPHRLGTLIQCIRCTFKFGFESGLLNTPIRFGPGFKRPSKKTLRLNRAKQDRKLFSAEEIRALLDKAGLAMKAMILLGINCGFGNSDCGNLPLSAVDLHAGWIDFARPKTGIERRIPLWTETVDAIKRSLAKRPQPKGQADAQLVFVTKYGESWAKDRADSPITKEMRKLLTATKIGGHRNFYALRHTFRTVADEAKDQPAADYIMGHESPHMSTVYRERISDERLKAIVDHLHRWLFAGAGQSAQRA